MRCQEYRDNVGSSASEVGARVADIQERFNTTRGFVRYWKRKTEDPTYHIDTWGGNRNKKFVPQQDVVFQLVLWGEVQLNPVRTVQQFADRMSQYYGWEVERMFITRVFHSWKLSIKNINYKSLNKFTDVNILRYGAYLMEICTLSWPSVKFLDESHFDTRGNCCFLCALCPCFVVLCPCFLIFLSMSLFVTLSVTLGPRFDSWQRCRSQRFASARSMWTCPAWHVIFHHMFN